jgi:hypothetical protein
MTSARREGSADPGFAAQPGLNERAGGNAASALMKLRREVMADSEAVLPFADRGEGFHRVGFSTPERGRAGWPAALRTAGSSQRRKGLVSSSTRIVVGTVARPAWRVRAPLSTAALHRDAAGFDGERRSACCSGCIRGRSTQESAPATRRAWPGACICAGVPSNRRPHPAPNSVSPQNSAPSPSMFGP